MESVYSYHFLNFILKLYVQRLIAVALAGVMEIVNDMPTLPQKKEAIRDACIQANPLRGWTDQAVNWDDNSPVDVRLPVLLSDVLLAYDKVGRLGWTEERLYADAAKLITHWNLLRPSLDDQDETTINLVYEILCAK
jgi:hypothetical protein